MVATLRDLRGRSWIKINQEAASAVIYDLICCGVRRAKKLNMNLNLMACVTGWVEIAHTKEGKIEDSAVCCGYGMGFCNMLS